MLTSGAGATAAPPFMTHERSQYVYYFYALRRIVCNLTRIEAYRFAA